MLEGLVSSESLGSQRAPLLQPVHVVVVLCMPFTLVYFCVLFSSSKDTSQIGLGHPKGLFFFFFFTFLSLTFGILKLCGV